MGWLCGLFCPPGGTVCDPFMGSGATGIAAVKLGLDFVGIEADPGYFALAERRIAAARSAYPLFDAMPIPPGAR
jgi:DNA modification methylase